MSMHMSMSRAVIAVLAGCGLAASPEATDQASLTLMPTCPDGTTDCTHTNGSGVFFEEGGQAGINTSGANSMLMITEFMNHAPMDHESWVTFRGRYRYKSSPTPIFPAWEVWQFGDGTVDSADYGSSLGLRVIAVSEQSTMPTWTLVDPATPGTQTLVTGNQLAQLKLHITFLTLSLAPVRVLLEFDGGPRAMPDEDHPFDPDHPCRVESDPDDKTHPCLQALQLRWRVDKEPLQDPTPYCFRSPKPDGGVDPDPVVFQQGISVDPITGAVAFDSSVVTMSCSKGAVAKAYNWGYPYVDQHDGQFFDGFFYRAAIQMKRASYCGDWQHYTVAGTRIAIHDSRDVNTDDVTHHVFEARWEPTGAFCINPDGERHPELDFSGGCGGPTALRLCSSPPSVPAGSLYLDDYAKPPP